MDSWDSTTPSANLKFENSPAESFLSVPGDMYPSLFAPATSTVNPLEMMSPQSTAEDDNDLSVLDLQEETEGDKKTTKKRKSWGQVLPEPKTNLPPRKRAKTEDEKEQRRVERVLRNRRAAQSSRERKRLEVEALEKRNKQLETALLQARQANMALMEQVHSLQRSSGVTPTPFRASPTFSQELFSSQDGTTVKLEQTQALEDLMSSVSDNTVNPASLSPTLTPVAEEDDEETAKEPLQPAPVEEPTGASPDASHPAAMCDLQCRSAEAPRWLTSQARPTLALFWMAQLLLTSTSAMLSLCQRPLMQIAMSLRAGYSLPPTPVMLNTIIWMVTTPLSPSPSPTLTSSTSTNSSTTNSAASPTGAQPRTRPSTLRLKSLRKILTSSPILARPLSDATMAVLRLVSTEGRDASSADKTAFAAANPWRNDAALPSREVLLTLLWAIQVEERRIETRSRRSETGRQSVSHMTSRLGKRTRTEEHFTGVVDFKRRRLAKTKGPKTTGQSGPDGVGM